MKRPPTNELLTRYAKSGDEPAFRELVERYAGLVVAAAARRLGNRNHLAQDVAQAVFVSLAQRAKFLPRDVVLPAWLHTVAVRRALNMIRSETRRERREAVSASSTVAPSFENTPEWQTLSPEIDEAIASLSKRDRDAIGARFLDGNDIAGTADALGISQDATKKRVARALGRLRARLDRRGVTAATATIATFLAAPEIHAGATIATRSMATAALASKPGALAIVGGSIAGHPISAAVGVAGALVLSFALTGSDPDEKPIKPQLDRSKKLTAIDSRTLPAEGNSPILDAVELEVEDLLAQLERLATAPRTAVNKAKLNLLIATIPTGIIRPLMELADEKLSLPAKYRLMRPLVDHFAEHDPAGAMDFVIAHTIDLQLSDQGFGISSFVFEQWWKHDQAASVDWLARNIHRPDFNYAMGTRTDIWIRPLRRLAAADPIRASQIVNRLPPSRLTTAMRGRLAPESYHNNWGRPEWSGLADKVAAAADSKRFLYEVVGNWAETDDAGVVEWIEKNTDANAKLTAALGRLAAEDKYEVTRYPNGGISRRSIGVKDRPERASLALQQVDSLPLDEALVKIGETWPPSEEAIHWLLERGPDGESDRALAALARKFSEDRELPMRIAGEIRNPELRRRALAGAYLRWQVDRPDDASAWLSFTPLPEADLALLKETRLP